MDAIFKGKFPLFLAPMARYTDVVFRELCKRQGADVMCTEFVMAESLLRDHPKAWEAVDFTEHQRPMGVQLFGSEPEQIARAARMVQQRLQPNFIDINCGCPARRVTDGAAGASLLKDPRKIERIVRATLKALAEEPSYEPARNAARKQTPARDHAHAGKCSHAHALPCENPQAVNGEVRLKQQALDSEAAEGCGGLRRDGCDASFKSRLRTAEPRGSAERRGDAERWEAGEISEIFSELSAIRAEVFGASGASGFAGSTGFRTAQPEALRANGVSGFAGSTGFRTAQPEALRANGVSGSARSTGFRTAQPEALGADGASGFSLGADGASDFSLGADGASDFSLGADGASDFNLKASGKDAAGAAGAGVRTFNGVSAGDGVSASVQVSDGVSGSADSNTARVLRSEALGASEASGFGLGASDGDTAGAAGASVQTSDGVSAGDGAGVQVSDGVLDFDGAGVRTGDGVLDFDGAAMGTAVSVKIRTGWDENSVVALEVAKRVQDAGASMLTVHGRTKAQGYQGEADWELIERVAETLTIPVVGNGGIRDCRQFVQLRENTRVAGLMIGRAALGYPWIFREFKHYLATGELLPPPSLAERWHTFFEFVELWFAARGPHAPLGALRTKLVALTRQAPGARALRPKLEQMRSLRALAEIAKEHLRAYGADHENGAFNAINAM